MFLSARPHAYKDLVEEGAYRRFRQLHAEGRLHTHPTMLSGSLASGAKAVAIHALKRAHVLALELAELIASGVGAGAREAEARLFPAAGGKPPPPALHRVQELSAAASKRLKERLAELTF